MGYSIKDNDVNSYYTLKAYGGSDSAIDYGSYSFNMADFHYTGNTQNFAHHDLLSAAAPAAAVTAGFISKLDSGYHYLLSAGGGTLDKRMPFVDSRTVPLLFSGHSQAPFMISESCYLNSEGKAAGCTIIRYNSSSDTIEGYNGSSWKTISQQGNNNYLSDAKGKGCFILMCGAGGGGGAGNVNWWKPSDNHGGGGGGGGATVLAYLNLSAMPDTSIYLCPGKGGSIKEAGNASYVRKGSTSGDIIIQAAGGSAGSGKNAGAGGSTASSIKDASVAGGLRGFSGCNGGQGGNNGSSGNSGGSFTVGSTFTVAPFKRNFSYTYSDSDGNTLRGLGSSAQKPSDMSEQYAYGGGGGASLLSSTMYSMYGCGGQGEAVSATLIGGTSTKPATAGDNGVIYIISYFEPCSLN